MVKEFASCGEFKHEKIVVLGLEPLDQLDDMLMLEGHEGVLSVHLLGMVADAVLVDNLDRDLFSIGCRRQAASGREWVSRGIRTGTAGLYSLLWKGNDQHQRPTDAAAAGGFAD